MAEDLKSSFWKSADKLAWQTEDGSRKMNPSATGESTNIGMKVRSDDYDRGELAWQNAGKYLHHGGGNDHRVKGDRPLGTPFKSASWGRIASTIGGGVGGGLAGLALTGGNPLGYAGGRIAGGLTGLGLHHHYSKKREEAKKKKEDEGKVEKKAFGMGDISGLASQAGNWMSNNPRATGAIAGGLGGALLGGKDHWLAGGLAGAGAGYLGGTAYDKYQHQPHVAIPAAANRLTTGIGEGVTGAASAAGTAATQLRKKLPSWMQPQPQPQMEVQSADAATPTDSSSALGRYFGLGALQRKSNIEHPGTGSLQALGDIIYPPVGNIPNMIANRQSIGKGPSAEPGLNAQIEDAHKRKGHFGSSFMHGAGKGVIPGLALGGIGALLTGAGKGFGPDSGQAMLTTGLGGAVGVPLAFGAHNAWNDTVLGRTSPETNKRIVPYLARNPAVSGLPFGDVAGAINTRDSKQLKHETKAASVSSPGFGLKDLAAKTGLTPAQSQQPTSRSAAPPLASATGKPASTVPPMSQAQSQPLAPESFKFAQYYRPFVSGRRS